MSTNGIEDAVGCTNSVKLVAVIIDKTDAGRIKGIPGTATVVERSGVIHHVGVVASTIAFAEAHLTKVTLEIDVNFPGIQVNVTPPGIFADIELRGSELNN